MINKSGMTEEEKDRLARLEPLVQKAVKYIKAMKALENADVQVTDWRTAYDGNQVLAVELLDGKTGDRVWIET